MGGAKCLRRNNHEGVFTCQCPPIIPCPPDLCYHNLTVWLYGEKPVTDEKADFKPEKARPGRPAKSWEDKKRAVTVWLSPDEIIVLDQLTKMRGLNRSRLVASLITSEKPDWNCQCDSPAAKGRVEGAYKTRLHKAKLKMKDLTPAPVYIIRAPHLNRPSFVPSGAMKECQTSRENRIIYGRIWAVSEKALCFLSPMLDQSSIYPDPECAAEGLELNRAWLAGQLQKRISSGVTECYFTDSDAVADAAAEMEKLIEQRTADGYGVFGK